MNNFYIYVYLDPGKNREYIYYEPFYVGKGKNKRYLTECGRNEDFINIINEIKSSELEPIIIKLFKNLNEKESLKKETELINKIGRINLGTRTLINKTSGGQGISGYKHTKKTRKIMSDKKKGIKRSEETRNKISKNCIGMIGKKHSEESKIKMSISHKGKHHSKEIKNKISKSELGKNSKLKNGEVWLIKKILDSDYYKSGKITQTFIGKMFNIDQTTISLIKSGKIWSHIKLGDKL